ncbi:MAG TPA: translation initiation factor IF-2 [Aggregatilinea sp.]|uniref:translation initiation factor IF-2 n=1 Tax=Aggregatilinea sp. TaxID=2806333 RepID=UPI002C8C96E2|nr:translation initiation factor IF-2 [Aggregatilinea sp.]HML22835.1 translation initiation factor IF-2 [Aggregatilinea sp.]
MSVANAMAQEKQIIEVPDFLTVRELADLVEASPIEVMKELISNGIMASINQQIDYDTAAIVLDGLGYEARPTSAPEAEADEAAEDMPQWRRLYAGEDPSKLVRRPPVVTVLGHVDHGKTSLLDVIRKAHVQEGEAGGITQHIGAYQVKLGDNLITFLDTPGHEAFTAMRARGAQGADIAVLVVAADDGVMPTTREALAHIRAAHVPVVVALNKIDKPNANPEFVKQQLAEVGLSSDEWGGDTLVVPVSAKTQTGIDDLLEAILLVAEELDIRANPDHVAAGTVLEGSMHANRGPIATLLVQNGTLHTGDVVIAGQAQGRIKGMFDEFGKPVKEAGPSCPVIVMGLDESPHAGDLFEVSPSVKEARSIVAERRDAAAAAAVRPAQSYSLEDIFSRFQAGETKELRLIIKVDVYGSLEPVVAEVENLATNDLKVRVLHADVGEITENDVNLASASNAIILGFNAYADSAAQRIAESNGVDIRSYSVIYKLIEDVEMALNGMLDPVYADRTIGVAEVRRVIRVPKVGAIAGSYVLEGTARRNAKTRVVRRGQTIAEGITVGSLKRFEEDVREVRKDFECGIGLDNFHDFEEGDRIEFYVRERVN